MLIVLTELKRIGSTDHKRQDVSFPPETIHRMVPHDETSVRVTFEDGEEMTLVGKIRELTEEINGSMIPDVIEHLG